MPAYHRGMDDDLVFRALADPNRRHLLDRLHARDGQTLRELCEDLRRHSARQRTASARRLRGVERDEEDRPMSRQAVAAHLRLLESAGLVASRRAGRAKHHFLLQEPIQRVAQDWFRKFEYPRPSALPPDAAAWPEGSGH